MAARYLYAKTVNALSSNTGTKRFHIKAQNGVMNDGDPLGNVKIIKQKKTPRTVGNPKGGLVSAGPTRTVQDVQLVCLVVLGFLCMPSIKT
jgi:hypothetical protein